MPAPNLLGRHSTDQQVSTKHHTVFSQPPLDKPAWSPQQIDTPLYKQKNKTKLNKQGTEN
jgi:hypothetical protein